ncbi:MAG: DNA polymerase III subunit beta [Synergistaceae bacterium]|nr:DNA polymerase III subunit beta [Synergistaceae bacterium]MBR2209657.1 DNA polymerase III subunit beta [Synergistaceae bacterium]
MKLELNRKDFLKSWQLAERFVDTKSVNDAIRGVFIEAKDDGFVTLKSTNLKTSIKCRAEGTSVLESGAAVIPVAVFGDMLRKANTDELMLDVNSERGFLKAGKSKVKFTVIPTEQFPNIPDTSEARNVFVTTCDLLKQLIMEGSSASSVPTDFPKYIGTCLIRTKDNEIKVAATDGKRLSLSKRACTEIEKETDLLLPSLPLKEIAKMLTGDKSVQVMATETTAFFILVGLEFSIQLVDASFPQYERILNDVVETTLTANSGDLFSALERIDIIAKTTPAHIMALSLNPNGELKITARAPEAGVASEEFLAEIDGNPMLVGFNVGYFFDGLRILGSGNINIEFSGSEGQARMKRVGDDNFLYMLMPARLSEQDKVADGEF